MQAVYEAKLRYDLIKQNKRFSVWLDEALERCCNSIAYTYLVNQKYTILPALFTGRRTGGMIFLILQNLLFSDHFTQFSPGTVVENKMANKLLLNVGFTKPVASLGTSSCDSWYFLKTIMGLPCLNPAGTHAHELSMVCSILFPQVDHFHPFSQVIGHNLYRKLVMPITKGVMPMLPDTLGTPAFMESATIVHDYNENNVLVPFLSFIGSARQDSGRLPDFVDNMKYFQYTKGMMASEIDTTNTLLEAAKYGYGTFGAGGFFGDSEKVWGDPRAPSNSMAVKAVRVAYQNKRPSNASRSLDDMTNWLSIPYINYVEYPKMVIGYPVKTGDPDNRFDPNLKEGKLSLDKTLAPDVIERIKQYAVNVRTKALPKRTGVYETTESLSFSDFFDMNSANGISLSERGKAYFLDSNGTF